MVWEDINCSKDAPAILNELIQMYLKRNIFVYNFNTITKTYD